MTGGDFIGCKVALLHAGCVLVYLRDVRPDLPWPGFWDLPGGGREGVETPQNCLLREVTEEFGLVLPSDRLIFHRIWPSIRDDRRLSHFFAGYLRADEIDAIRFGDEGQEWRMMPVAEFVSHPQAVPEMQRRTAIAVAAL